MILKNRKEGKYMLDILLAQLETKEEKELIEKLYHEYQAQMYSAAYAILQHKQDSEDAVQSAFEKVMEHILDYDLNINQDTQLLLTVITRNIARNEIKKRNRKLEHEFDVDIDEIVSVNEDFDKISFEEIKNFISKLPFDLKNVIVMRFFLDKSPNDIANLLDIIESAVYKRIAEARKLLKDIMEPTIKKSIGK